jgi:uncharacterized repeat protein (TIGR02543 family)
VGAKSAWAADLDGSGVNVAVIDTGIVYGHEDFDRSRIIDSYDFVNKDGSADDDNSHGSMVSGVIAAETDNVAPGAQYGTGMAGLAYNANLLVYKVLDGNGEGYADDIVRALDRILKLIENGTQVDVVNLSLGHAGTLWCEESRIQRLIEEGVIIVAAAGNTGPDVAPRTENLDPASYSGVIGVGSVGPGGKASSFSAKNTSVDIAAPGESIVGPQFDRIRSRTDTYRLAHGTSFASPIVAAAAAMAKQRDREFTADRFLGVLKTTAREAGDDGYDTAYGNGILSFPALAAYLNDEEITVDGESAGQGPSVVPGEISAEPFADSSDDGGTPPDDGETPSVPSDENPPGDRGPPSDAPDENLPDDGADKDAFTVKKQAAKYKVNFHVNGGRQLVKGKRVKTVTSGRTYGKLPTPGRRGYEFKGWYTKRTGGARIKSETVVKLRKSQTLYAHWKKG